VTSRPPPQCLLCTHFRSPLTGAPEQTCDAYPDGIPDPIWNNHADHRQPQDGDQGITWESDRPFPEWILDDADGPDAEGPMEDDEEAKARRSRQLALLDTRTAGHDVTPGNDRLHHWWTRGPGLKLWIGSPHQFTTLRAELAKATKGKLPPGELDRMAASWVHEVTGEWPGSDLHRIQEGGKPRGHRVGPG